MSKTKKRRKSDWEEKFKVWEEKLPDSGLGCAHKNWQKYLKHFFELKDSGESPLPVLEEYQAAQSEWLMKNLKKMTRHWVFWPDVLREASTPHLNF